MEVSHLYNKVRSSSIYYSLLLALTQSLIAIFFLGIDFYFSKGLTVEDFGVWKKLIFFINLLIPILSFGVPEGYKYYLAKEKDTGELLSKTITSYFLITLVMLLFAFLINLAGYVGWTLISDYYIVSFLVPVAYFAFILNKTLRYNYINYSKIPTHTKITLAALSVSSIFLGFTWIYFDTVKPFYLYTGIFLYILLYILPIFKLIQKTNQIVRFQLPDKEYLYKVLRQGIPLYLATFIGTLTLNLDLLIVSALENIETFAVFSVGALEIPIFAMLSAAFSQRIYPELVRLISNNNKVEAKKLWIKTTIQISYFTYPLIILLMYFAEDLIFTIYSPKYFEAIFLFKTYLLVGIFRNNYYGALITASGDTKYITFYALIMLATNAIVSCFLYYFFGVKGIVFGTVISTIVIQFLQLRHEKMISLYIREVLLNYKISLLIIIIIITYLLT